MGCSASKLEDEEPVRLCRERKNFVKEAVDQRSRFAAGHLAYTESLRQVSEALRNYLDTEDYRHDFFSDVCSTPPFTPLRKLSFPESERMIHCLRSGGAPANLTVEERPPSPETIRINSYYEPYEYYGGIGGLFSAQPQEMTGSFAASPRENPNWDFFWNPFSSASYGFSYQSVEEDPAGLRQIREEEGIPELEEEEEEEEHAAEEEEAEEEEEVLPPKVIEPKFRELKRQQVDVMKASAMAEVEEEKERTPDFTVYLNRRTTSMAEVMRDIESQFARMHESAREISLMLEASKAKRPSSNELMAGKLLNPAALLRSTSFRSSTSSRFYPAAAEDDGYDSADSGMISGSHYSTLEKLCIWEKKLYEEVKGGERIRVAYEKKCAQLRKKDINGADPFVADRTRLAARDLLTHLKVSIHSVESISERIVKLRDDELFPQLLELIQGMSRMWRTMADGHRIQKLAIDGAKQLLATAPLAARGGTGLASPAARLEAELRNWRRCLKIWVNAQRCYIRALTGWLLRCARAPANDDARIEEKSPLSPPRSDGAPPVFGLCVQWTRMLDGVSEDRAVEGLDFFAAGIFTVASQQREAEAAKRGEEDNGAPEKMAELAVRVLFAGMSVAISALAEFAGGSRDGYEELQRRWAQDGGAEAFSYLKMGASLRYQGSDKAVGTRKSG